MVLLTVTCRWALGCRWKLGIALCSSEPSGAPWHLCPASVGLGVGRGDIHPIQCPLSVITWNHWSLLTLMVGVLHWPKGWTEGIFYWPVQESTGSELSAQVLEPFPGLSAPIFSFLPTTVSRRSHQAFCLLMGCPVSPNHIL